MYGQTLLKSSSHWENFYGFEPYRSASKGIYVGGGPVQVYSVIPKCGLFMLLQHKPTIVLNKNKVLKFKSTKGLIRIAFYFLYFFKSEMQIMKKSEK